MMPWPVPSCTMLSTAMTRPMTPAVIIRAPTAAPTPVAISTAPTIIITTEAMASKMAFSHLKGPAALSSSMAFWIFLADSSNFDFCSWIMADLTFSSPLILSESFLLWASFSFAEIEASSTS